MLAALQGSTSEVHALLKAGANPNKKFKGEFKGLSTYGPTILMVASSDPINVKHLLEFEADPLLEDDIGQNAIEFLKEYIKRYKPRTVAEAIAQARKDLEWQKDYNKEEYERLKKRFGANFAKKLISPLPKLEDLVNENLAFDRNYIQDLKESLKLIEEAVGKRSDK